MRGPHPSSDRLDAGPELGPHAALDLVQRGGHLAHRGARDQRAGVLWVGEPAANVREEDRLVGAQGRGDLARGLVGVDVVGVAVPVRAGGGDHRDVVLGDVVEDVDVHPLDLADEADLVGVGMRANLEQRPVLARKAHRRLPVPVQPADDVRVHLAEQDHLRHLHRLGIGDAHPLDEPDLHSQPLQVTGDVGASAVDDHRVQAHVLEQHDVRRKALAQLLVAHRGAPVLDHHGAAVEVPDVGERLEQGVDVAPGLGPLAARRSPLAHVEYSEFSST